MRFPDNSIPLVIYNMVCQLEVAKRIADHRCEYGKQSARLSSAATFINVRMQRSSSLGVTRRRGILVGIECRPGTWCYTRPSKGTWIEFRRLEQWYSMCLCLLNVHFDRE